MMVAGEKYQERDNKKQLAMVAMGFCGNNVCVMGWRAVLWDSKLCYSIGALTEIWIRGQETL